MKNIAVSMAALLSALLQVTAHAAGVAATVNAQPVEQAWVDAVKQEARESAAQIDNQTIVANLIRNELLSQEATRQGIDKRPDFVAMSEVKHRELLASFLIRDYFDKNPISEDTLKAAYTTFKQKLGDKEYQVRHIQLDNEADAKDVIAQLSRGADFATLAKQRSTDKATKDKGGLVGWVAKGTLKPPLGDALSKLQKGLFNTVPLQTDASSWHILKLEDVRDLQAPPYDKVKGQLLRGLRAQQVSQLVKDLRTKAKIVINK